MNISDIFNPDRNPKQTFGLKAESTLHRITHNPNSANPEEILRVQIPKLSENIVIVPGSVCLVFDLFVVGHANNRLVNNISRNLIRELKVSYGGETIQIIQRYDLFKTYEDLFISNEKRDSGLIKYGISNEAIRKLRAGAGDKPSSPNAKDKVLAEIHGTKYRILIDHSILNDHGIFYPRGLINSLNFQLTLAPVSAVVVYSDTTKPPNYSLANIELEYSCVYSDQLANQARSNYQVGKSFLYEYISLEKTFTITLATDEIINQQINIPRRSIQGLLLLFRDDTPGSIDSENFVSPNILEIKITINGMPNRLYSKGMAQVDFWEAINKRFSAKYLSQKDFYGASKFAAWIDMRTFPSNDIHGGGLKLDSSQGGIQLMIKRKTGGSGTILCYIYVISDAVMDIMNSDLHSISY